MEERRVEPKPTVVEDAGRPGHRVDPLGYAHSCADLCTAVWTCAQLCGLVHSYADLCTALQTCAWPCRLVHSCVHNSAQLGQRVEGSGRVEVRRICTQLCRLVHSCADLCTVVQACAQLCAQLCTTRATGRRQREGRGAADMYNGAVFVHSSADLCTAV